MSDIQKHKMSRGSVITHNGNTGEHYGKHWRTLTKTGEEVVLSGKSALSAKKLYESKSGEKVVFMRELKD